MDAKERHAVKYPLIAKSFPKLIGVERPSRGLDDVTKAMDRLNALLSEMQKLAKSYRTAARWNSAASLPKTVDSEGNAIVDVNNLTPRQKAQMLRAIRSKD